MKSTFFHVGVNRTMAKEEGLTEPHIRTDGFIPYIPLPSHHDPDFENLTYGDPFGRLERLQEGDVAWFIESGTISGRDWGYYLVSFFVVEDTYCKRSGTWNKPVNPIHRRRIAKNAHETRGDEDYAIILGDKESSPLLFANPVRISMGEDPLPVFKQILGLPERPARGYWFKKWLGDEVTRKLLEKFHGSRQPRFK